MARKDGQDAITTMAPESANMAYTHDPRSLNEGDWNTLGQDLYQGVLSAINARSALNQNLIDWTNLYEMRVDQKDSPWVNASNVFIPIIPSQLNTSLAYIASKVFVPRFYIVTGNTEDAASTAHDVERYYNAELVRQRGQTTWYDQYLTWLHLAYRDGTSIMEILWRKTTTKRKVVTYSPVLNKQGIPIIDQTTGRPKTQKQVQEVDVVDYDDVEMKPVLLRDFLLIPDEATSIEDAVGVARALFLYEDELQAMVADGVLNGEEVERALTYVPTGQNDIQTDMQGYEDRTAGDQVQPGIAQGTQVSRFFKNRGPIKVWRIHTRQYDMNDDGQAEENIFYLHELSQRMLGWTEYAYIVPSRPYFAFCPDPRPDRFYGYSLPERLAPIQAEVNAMYNQRNDLVTLMLNPPLLFKVGDELDDNEQQWGPGVRWNVQDPASVQFLQFPNVPVASFQQEAMLVSYVDKLEGTSAPAMGSQSPGKRSAQEMRIQAAASVTRNDLTAGRLRVVCRAMLAFIHSLKLQYVENDPMFTVGDQKYKLPREVLAKDYQLDISGSSDPIDATSRRQETMGLFQILSQVPWIANDMEKSYRLVRKVMEAFNWPDITPIIGTDQEAQQRGQAQQQEQQEQKKIQTLMMLSGQGGQHAKPQGPKPPKPMGG